MAMFFEWFHVNGVAQEVDGDFSGTSGNCTSAWYWSSVDGTWNNPDLPDVPAPLPKLWEAPKMRTGNRITTEARRATQRIPILVRAILVNHQCHWAWYGNCHHDNKVSWASLLRPKFSAVLLFEVIWSQSWERCSVTILWLRSLVLWLSQFCANHNSVKVTILWLPQFCANHNFVPNLAQIVRWSCKQHNNR